MAGLIQLHKPHVWLLVAGAIVLLMGVKLGRPLLTPAGPPIALNDQPALIFFNNEDGCECVIPLYQKADAVVAHWQAAQSAPIPIHRIVLDARPDLQRQYQIERAPMLVLLDERGDIVWREWGVASNPDVFNMTRVETKVKEVISDVN